VTGEGIFKYIVEKHALSVVKKGDFRKALADAALGQDCVRHAAATIVLTCVAGRTTARYGNRGQMYIHIEAGHAAQNIHLEAVALGLGSVPVGAFDDAQAAETLGCGGREQPLYMIPVGRIGK
jgi:SagB-type dehydrogenase family enzyme